MPDLMQRPMFRIAFVCFVAGSRTDPRQLQPADAVLSDRTMEQDLDPVLRRDPQGVHPASNGLCDWIVQTVGPALEPLLAWSTRERWFLDRLLDHGEVIAEALHDDSDVQERIRRQPMLNWKAQHVRARRRIP
jgi:hypothetical protein